MLGFDPSLTRRWGGTSSKRAWPPGFSAAHDNSLPLEKKPRSALPHGGGLAAGRDVPTYETIRRWIDGGLPKTNRPERRPLARSRASRRARHGAQVIEQIASPGPLLRWSNADVTGCATFSRAELRRTVSREGGLITGGRGEGESTLMGRYDDQDGHLESRHPFFVGRRWTPVVAPLPADFIVRASWWQARKKSASAPRAVPPTQRSCGASQPGRDRRLRRPTRNGRF